MRSKIISFRFLMPTEQPLHLVTIEKIVVSLFSSEANGENQIATITGKNSEYRKMMTICWYKKTYKMSLFFVIAGTHEG